VPLGERSEIGVAAIWPRGRKIGPVLLWRAAGYHRPKLGASSRRDTPLIRGLQFRACLADRACDPLRVAGGPVEQRQLARVLAGLIRVFVPLMQESRMNDPVSFS
jgi:hypothetical protein